MVKRLLNPINKRSFFLFGARGVGKTSWLNQHFKSDNTLWLDLLDEDLFELYSVTPNRLDLDLVTADKNKKIKYVVIDEVQRVPRLLNVVQKWMTKKRFLFALTGSSSRKLKRGSANLLAGRANSYAMFPFSYIELESRFNLDEALNWGLLPELQYLKSDREKKSYLKSYCNNYLKEEIIVEQLIRNLPPFRQFLSILAQNEGQLINFEKFARDVGVENKTVQSYIEILEDTHIGLLLRAHSPSLRKSQLKMPKFYFFDCGISRQLSGKNIEKIVSKTSDYGNAFESFIINEIQKINEYLELEYSMSFFTTKHGFEIDLILSKVHKIYIEIKSTNKVDLTEVMHLENNLADLIEKKDRILYISRDMKPIRVGIVECVPWNVFLKDLSS